MYSVNDCWLIDKWDHLFNSEACQKIYPMHTVLLVKLFDTKNKLFVLYQGESKLFVFFFAFQ